ncbi:BrnT family toxin [Candidatus Rickettsia kedanie]|uniref:BrnT family toxin n=1 Tax=Candidatus Rickettsia kedanie TaxID=3115352 RepID=UPI00399D4D5E
MNIEKHKVSFYETQKAFLDIQRIILEDIDHSITEKRYFCLGQVDGNILTVRFMF